ncbi:MAG: OmpA family protein [Burkholderiales bacterium]
MGDTSGLFLSVTEGGTGADHAPIPPLNVLAGPATGSESNLIRAAIFPLACWRLGDIRFHFDSSFVVPEARAEFQSLSRLIKNHTGKLGPPPLSIFGHADPTGNDDYNKALSGRRAAAIYAALTRRTEIWEDLFSNTGKFAQPAAGDQWADAAIGSMRTALNRTETGKTTAVQRQSLFLEYMNFLCIDDGLKPFQVDPKAGFLGGQADALGKGDYQGCSEFNPILLLSRADQQKFAQQKDHTERDSANAPNRRVMVLLFRPGSKIVPSRWPCPRAKEPTAACRKRFFSDGEKRRSNQESKREFKDKEDTFACRFYQRLVTRSPCERADKPPLIVALFDTHTQERDTKMELLVFDGSDKQVLSIPGERSDERAGFFLFRFDPATLPNPVRLEWRTSSGNRHLAGPCNPVELRDALASPDLKTADALTRDPPAAPPGGSGDIPVEDDVMSNMAILRVEGGGIEEIV